MRWMLAMLLVTVAVAGCTDTGDDGDGDVASSANVAYNGSGTTQRSEMALCDQGEAQILGGATVDDGSLQVTVRDGSGQQVFQQAYNDEVELEGEVVDGAEGQWTISTQGSDGFAGDYTFTIACT